MKIIQNLKIHFHKSIFIFIFFFANTAVFAANPDTCLGDGDGVADCRPPIVGEFNYQFLWGAGLFDYWKPGDEHPPGCVASTPGDDLKRTIESGTGIHIACWGKNICSGGYISHSDPVAVSSLFSLYPNQLESTVHYYTVETPHSNSGPSCASIIDRTFNIRWNRDVYCPQGYSPNDYTEPYYRYCYRNEIVEPPDCRMGACPTPNPIDPISGAKLRREVDYMPADGLLSIVRYYHGYSHARREKPVKQKYLLGNYWQFSVEKSLAVSGTSGNRVVYIDHEDGSTTTFKEKNDKWVALDNKTEALNFQKGSSTTAAYWIFKSRHNTIEIYNSDGRLVSITNADGSFVRVNYGDKYRIINVQDSFSKKLVFNYHPDSGDFTGITDANGKVINYSYGNIGYYKEKTLLKVIASTGAARSFTYGEGTSGAGPMALTGIIDENGNRYATFDYSILGNAASSELANGVDGYYVWPGSSIQTPLLDRYWYTTQNIANMKRVTQIDHSYEASEKFEYDNQGNRTVYDSYTGKRTCFVNDLIRNLPSARIEGLENSVTCASVITPGTNLPSGSRKITTQWHPDWRLEARVALPENLVTLVYNGQADPTAGGAIATCAPAGALLPTGKPIAVLCKRVEQPTTDLDGRLGLAAPVKQGSTARTWKWTYTSAGLVATATAPNGAVTTHTYDSAGNRTQSKNALGHVDSYTNDGAGRILTHTAPNGHVSTYTYDARGRLLSASQAGLTTTLAYTASGQIAQASLPSGHRITYTYDAAQRLVGWSDNRGANATYQLDAMGNRVKEQIKNSQGQTAWLLARSINSLNRVETTTVGSHNPTTYSYDANGDLVGASQTRTDTSPETTTLARDALRRITQITNPENASASLAYNALDAITQASDYKNTATGYQRDALGNATKETSADSGSQTAQYDSLGLLQSQTDALGRKHTLTRDALGRPTQVSHTSGASTPITTTTSTLRYDLPGAAYNASGTASVGYLSEIQDPGVTTRYQRDTLGRITQKTQILASGDTRSTQYSYVPAGSAGAGSILAITYPSGKPLVHQYSASGQLTALQWNGQPLVSGITWNPLGQPTAWQWPATAQSPGSSQKLAEQRNYTSAGQLAGSQLLQINWNATGQIASLSQKHRVPAATGTAAQETTLSSAYSYNSAGRLTASAHSAPSTLVLPAGWSISDTIGANASGYAYDSNGNRSQAYYSTDTIAGTATLERSIQTKEGTNQLQSQTQTTTAPGGTPQTSTTSYTQDAGGALTNKNNTNLTYSERGLLGKASTNPPTSTAAVSYTYNSAGQRILKSDARISATSPITEQTVYAEDDQGGSTVLGQYSNRRSASSAAPAGELDSTETIYLQTATGPLPIAAQINGRTYAIHADHLNTPRRLTNSQGQVAWQWVISGYGEAAPTTGAGGYAQPGLSNGKSYSEVVTYNLRYPGQVWDEETGLIYNLNRYYDKETGRYVTADPIGLGGGWNRFTYVEGNPLGAADPMGLQAAPGIGGLGVGSAAIPSLTNACLANPAVCGVGLAGAGGFAAGTLLYPHIEPTLSKVVDWCIGSDNESDREKKCEAQLERDEALCLVARAAHGPRGQAICLAKAKELYAQCLKGN